MGVMVVALCAKAALVAVDYDDYRVGILAKTYRSGQVFEWWQV